MTNQPKPALTPEQAHDSLCGECALIEDTPRLSCEVRATLRTLAAAAKAEGRAEALRDTYPGLPDRGRAKKAATFAMREATAFRGTPPEVFIETLAQEFARLRAEGRAAGRAECEAGHAPLEAQACDAIELVQEARKIALAQCAASHAALEREAERRGEERVRAILRPFVRRELIRTRYEAIPNVSIDVETGKGDSPLWWALTGEGERPEDKP